MPKSYRDPDRCPTHPGVVLRDIVLPAIDATKTDVAEALGISRNQLYQILAGRQPVTPITAVRLEAVIGGSARSWVNMQAAYDLWRAQRSFKMPKGTLSLSKGKVREVA